MVISQYLGDFYYLLVNLNSYNYQPYKLTSIELDFIDSLFLFDDKIKLYSKEDRLKKIYPKKHYYNKIRESVERDRNINSLLTLAKYKRHDDIGLITSFIKDSNTCINGIDALIEFNDSSFYPIVSNILIKEINSLNQNYELIKICIKVLLLYPKDETLALFNDFLISKNQSLYEILKECINKTNHEKFLNLKKKLNE